MIATVADRTVAAGWVRISLSVIGAVAALSISAGAVSAPSTPSGQIAVVASSSGAGSRAAAYLVDVRGGKPQLFSGKVFGVWSPDGRSFLGLLSSAGVEHPIGWLDLDSGRVTQVSPFRDNESDFWPAWSPDGTRIVYVALASTPGNPASLVVVSRDGTGASSIDSEPEAQSPQWSPDGNMIAFVNREAVVIKADGTSRRALSSGAVSDSPYTGAGQGPWLSWSSDSKRLAYSNGRSVVIANADGSGTRILTLTGANPKEYYDIQARWQPGGNEILFIRAWGDNGSPQRVGLVDADTGSVHFVATQDSITAACWSPDGAWIAYAGARVTHPGINPRGTSGVWVVRADGASDHQIARLPNPFTCAWRPPTR
jgi:Tol biopolymer transport system component